VPTPPHTILIVEDSDDDFLFFQRACRQLGMNLEVVRSRTADEARAYLDGLGAGAGWPVLILLDLNLPGTDGRTFLTEIKDSERLKSLPVVVYSTSSAPSDVQFCYANHVNAFHQKHLDFDMMKAELADILGYWTTRVRLPRSTS